MSDKPNSTLPAETETQQAGQVNETRRRLAKAGVAGSGVILTLASRTALGGWGQCTGSELMSGNLSKPGEANPCGCSPGYWGNTNGKATWDKLLGKSPVGIPAAYAKTAKFNDIFGLSLKPLFEPNANVTLVQAIDRRGALKAPRLCGKQDGILRTAAFHAVAALLNASVYRDRYPVPGTMQSPQGIITAFQTAVTNCALEAFIVTVDVYDPQSTWCFGDEHGGIV